MSLNSLQQKYAEEAAKRYRPEGLTLLTLQESSSDKLRALTDGIWADHNALNAQAMVASSKLCALFKLA
ncbi:unnamed protein product [Clonostachys rosea f. rosea IK726]|uniref:Uncharacterized protein n=1 Tax=Clonostachys rosea f. rosea IK726 TaxID=1349383 RepID=A0ACA9UM75_BIOOC|nr:unnamed protein product [Clonostachys rosea f. rosea IK726]